MKIHQMIFILVSWRVCYHFLKIWRWSVESRLRLVCTNVFVCTRECVHGSKYVSRSMCVCLCVCMSIAVWVLHVRGSVHVYKPLCVCVCMWMCIVQPLSHIGLYATPWTATRQASLSITISQSSPKFTSIELVMPFSHLILCRPLLLLPSIFPSMPSKTMNGSISECACVCVQWEHSGCGLCSIHPSHLQENPEETQDLLALIVDKGPEVRRGAEIAWWQSRFEAEAWSESSCLFQLLAHRSPFPFSLPTSETPPPLGYFLTSPHVNGVFLQSVVQGGQWNTLDTMRATASPPGSCGSQATHGGPRTLSLIGWLFSVFPHSPSAETLCHQPCEHRIWREWMNEQQPSLPSS